MLLILGWAACHVPTPDTFGMLCLDDATCEDDGTICAPAWAASICYGPGGTTVCTLPCERDAECPDAEGGDYGICEDGTCVTRTACL